MELILSITTQKCVKVIAVTCMLFAPLALIAIPVAIPLGITASPSYALDFAGGTFWFVEHLFGDLTYFTFYTFFKQGVNPDCIDMVEVQYNDKM